MYDNLSLDAAGMRRAAWIRQTAAVEAVRALVEAIGVREVLPVKGVVTARTLYADPSERPIADVDLRVRPAELGRVLAFARGRGCLDRHLAAYDNVVLTLEGVQIDVEAHVGPPGICTLTIDEMLARATIGDGLFGFPCASPELHDHALLMVVNAFKDKLVLAPGHSIEDLLRLARDPSFDPERLARLARAARASTLAWVVADWLGEERASEPWTRVRGALGRRPPRALYARSIRWLAPRAPGSIVTRLLARAACDDLPTRLRAFVRAARFEAWKARGA